MGSRVAPFNLAARVSVMTARLEGKNASFDVIAGLEIFRPKEVVAEKLDYCKMLTMPVAAVLLFIVFMFDCRYPYRPCFKSKPLLIRSQGLFL